MDINIFVVFFAGMGTFLAPCIIPLVPSYLSYISGFIRKDASNNMDLKKSKSQKFKVIYHTMFFILGFGSAFMILQILLFKFTNLASKLIGNNVLNIVFGSLIILMGLNMLGVFKITKLYSEKRFNFNFKRRNFLTSYFFGFAFGFGWTPCMGPVLFTVMSYLANSNTMEMGIVYIWVYTLGLGVPFLVFALFMENIKKLDFIKKSFLFSDKLSGVILIIMGLLLASNKLLVFANMSF